MSKLLTDIQRCLSSRYTPGEARAVAFALLEDAFGVGRTDVYADKVRQFSQEEEQRLQAILRSIGEGMPLQYATGVARFDGRLLHVSPATLIPRPETEQLVDMIAGEARARAVSPSRWRCAWAARGRSRPGTSTPIRSAWPAQTHARTARPFASSRSTCLRIQGPPIPSTSS